MRSSVTKLQVSFKVARNLLHACSISRFLFGSNFTCALTGSDIIIMVTVEGLTSAAADGSASHSCTAMLKKKMD
jgi:hypothetical protein